MSDTRLNLGCGEDKRSEYINIDVRKEVKPDIVADIRNLPQDDNSVKEVIIQDVLEHFSKPIKVLEEIYRVLKKNGKLFVRVPNWEKIGNPNFWKRTDFDKCENKVLGGRNNELDTHKSLFTEKILSQRMKRAGFADVETKKFNTPPVHWHLGGMGFKKTGLLRQEVKIKELLENDKWCLVVLDACRFDYFTEYMEAEPVRSPALNTKRWINKVWSEEYDAIYISGTPAIRRKFEGEEHFSEIIDVWDFGWEERTVPPENIVKAVRDNLNDKMVVHFIQPHAPYVGETELKTKDYNNRAKVRNIAKMYGNEKLKKAYKDNLKLVIEKGLKPLIEICKKKEQPLAVTSDHGELLGEDGNYGHNGPNHEILRKVPWKVLTCG